MASAYVLNPNVFDLSAKFFLCSLVLTRVRGNYSAFDWKLDLTKIQRKDCGFPRINIGIWNTQNGNELGGSRHCCQLEKVPRASMPHGQIVYCWKCYKHCACCSAVAQDMGGNGAIAPPFRNIFSMPSGTFDAFQKKYCPSGTSRAIESLQCPSDTFLIYPFFPRCAQKSSPRLTV